DSAGNLFVSNFGNNTIEKFTPGGIRSVFASSGLSQPEGLAFDSSGNLYAANWNDNTIEKFTSQGVPSLFASTSPYTPQFITVVPEPSTWALLSFGITTLLGTACLRQR